MAVDHIFDTSVWIQYYRDPAKALSSRLDPLIRAGRVATCGQILAELMQGVRSNKQGAQVVQDQASMHWIDTDRMAWIEAGMLAQAASAVGKQVGMGDCLIASVAKINGCKLLTLDRDFLRLKGVPVELL